MKSMKNFYLVMCFLGVVLPYYQLIAWIPENGFDLNGMANELFQSRIGMFGWADLTLSAIVLVAFILYDRIRAGVRYFYIPLLATLFIGLSLGLPLYLYMRESEA